MTRQEEIREGIAIIVMSSWCRTEKSEDTAYDIMRYLHSAGVVIKVDRELPQNPYPSSMFPMDVDEGGKIQRRLLGDKLTTSVNGGFGRHVYNFCQEEMGDAGYVAVEPLIKGEKWI